MSILQRAAALTGFLLISQAALAAQDRCGGAAPDVNAFIGERIILQLDAGRSADGSYPLWMEQFLGAPDIEGERLARYCAAHPDETLSAALDQMFTPERAAR